MSYKIYQVDAFADKVFSGNPAAVCPLSQWLDDATMLNIANENNLSETAFYVKQGDQYEIRWFTPTVEVDLCGHATFAAAFVLFYHENHVGETIYFHSPRSGKLTVAREGDLLTLNFPSDIVAPVELTDEIVAGFNTRPQAAYKGRTDYMVEFENEDEIRQLEPHLGEIAKLNARGIIATAKGTRTDFVSRFFGPQVGVNEDPVTGSAHTTLIPYWANKLGKNSLTAIQLSERRGFLQCRFLGERVEIGGYGKLYLIGEIFLS